MLNVAARMMAESTSKDAASAEKKKTVKDLQRDCDTGYDGEVGDKEEEEEEV